MSQALLYLANAYKANIDRQLGVPNVSHHNYKEMLKSTDRIITFSGLHFFLLNTMIYDLGKRCAANYILKITRRIASKHVASLRDKAAEEADKLSASGQCATALVPLHLAIELGHLPSRALKAWLLLDGKEGVAEDHSEAFELVKKGVRLGCHHCQGVMARCYWGGYGIRPDAARSLELARKSSESGSRYGQYVLGALYRFGEGGIAQDYAQALALYRLAAVRNLDEAQLSLGYINYDGEGSVVQDHVEALRWFKLAAAQGHTKALYWVAYCYENSKGVDINMAKAITWYKRAQAAGDLRAKWKLQRSTSLRVD